MRTSPRYQPLEIGFVVGDPLSVGGVASRLIVTDWVVERSTPFVAAQVNVVPVVSAESVVEVQPFWVNSRDSGSLAAHDAFTSDVYQPLAPCCPVTVEVTTGGVGVQPAVGPAAKSVDT